MDQVRITPFSAPNPWVCAVKFSPSGGSFLCWLLLCLSVGDLTLWGESNKRKSLQRYAFWYMTKKKERKRKKKPYLSSAAFLVFYFPFSYAVFFFVWMFWSPAEELLFHCQVSWHQGFCNFKRNCIVSFVRVIPLRSRTSPRAEVVRGFVS